MSDKLYGQCAICGGSLTADHKCWPIPPPTDKEWANESLRIALQNIQDAATKPLHIEIESLRSRLAEAEAENARLVAANKARDEFLRGHRYKHSEVDGYINLCESQIATLKARLADADALLREAREEVEWWTPCETTAAIEERPRLNRWFAKRDRIDAHLAREPK
jgi:hypothetical protein